jgi:ABC-type tungstate transport system permease subunit
MGEEWNCQRSCLPKQENKKKTLKKSDVANVVKKKNLHKIEIFFNRDSQLSNVYKTPKKDPALAHKNNNIKNKVNCS